MDDLGMDGANTGTKGGECFRNNSDLIEYFFKWQDIFTGN